MNKCKLQECNSVSYHRFCRKHELEFKICVYCGHRKVDSTKACIICKRRRKLKSRLLRLKILRYYSKNHIYQCNNCGIHDVRILNLDHIYNNGAKHRNKQKTGDGFNRWVWKYKPPIFQVLCCNCNWIKYVTDL